MSHPLLCLYLLNALIVAVVLSVALLSDRSIPKRHGASWVVILLASGFWFIAVPLSIAEIGRKVNQHRKTQNLTTSSR